MNWLTSEVKSCMWLKGKSACWNPLISFDWCPPSTAFFSYFRKEEGKYDSRPIWIKKYGPSVRKLCLDDWMLWYVFFFLEHGRFMFRPYLLRICMFISSVKLSLSVFDWSNASSSFDHFLSCRFCSHRDLKLKLTVQWNSWIAVLVYNYIHQPWVNEDARGLLKRTLLEFEGLLLGICKREYRWGDERWEVLRGLLCTDLRIRPNHPNGIANI